MSEKALLPFPESRPGLKEKIKDIAKNFSNYTHSYVKSLFPIVGWIGQYNLTWLSGDMVAGFSAASVVIPQGLAYATIVGVPLQYGLYSSFVGVFFYSLFATSKDITIGPTIALSLITGQGVTKILEHTKEYEKFEIASCFALITGLISIFIGLLRLRIVVDFIPAPVVSGFTSGFVLIIVGTSIPKLLGIKKISSSQASYLVFKNSFDKIEETKWTDFLMGFSALIYLYAIKYGCRYAIKRWPKYKKFFFFVSIVRFITSILIMGFIAWLLSDQGRKDPPVSILKKVPSGLHFGIPRITWDLVKRMVEFLPGVTLILILEHISIAKNFGRINDYRVDPSQEFIAIGLTNTLGTFFGGFPTTGSFTRTAIKAKAGVRTPLAGIFSGALIGIYVGTAVAFLVLMVRISRPPLEALGRVILKSANETKVSEKEYAYVPIGHPSFKSARNPSDGVIIFRFEESLLYPNANYSVEKIIDYVKCNTRRIHRPAEKKGDRPWNDSRKLSKEKEEFHQNLPRLRALIFDCCAVRIIDSTGVQALFDIKNDLNKYAGHEVEYHFANILDSNIQAILLEASFRSSGKGAKQLVAPGSTSDRDQKRLEASKSKDEESGEVNAEKSITSQTPKNFLHLTLNEAIEAVNVNWVECERRGLIDKHFVVLDVVGYSSLMDTGGARLTGFVLGLWLQGSFMFGFRFQLNFVRFIGIL
ncbi:hypothetical protein G9A89_010929 [Geosiphon pyriformis]|nr:hypothetical protein G9A89_010929 [Geosiphon pyriformis]